MAYFSVKEQYTIRPGLAIRSTGVGTGPVNNGPARAGLGRFLTVLGLGVCYDRAPPPPPPLNFVPSPALYTIQTGEAFSRGPKQSELVFSPITFGLPTIFQTETAGVLKFAFDVKAAGVRLPAVGEASGRGVHHAAQLEEVVCLVLVKVPTKTCRPTHSVHY